MGRLTQYVFKNRMIALGICFFLPHVMLGQTFQQLKDSVYAYVNINPDKAVQFGVEAMEIGYKEEYTLDLLKLNSRIGQILYEQDLDGEALRFYNESIKIFKALPVAERENPKVEYPPWLLVNIGNVFYQNGQNEKAQEYYTLAINNFQLYRDKETLNQGLSTSYDNLGLVSLRENDYEKALEYFNKSYEFRYASGKDEDILFSMSRFLNVYIAQNKVDAIEKQIKGIIEFYELSKKNYTKEKLITSYLTRNYGYAISSFASYLTENKQYARAIELLNECLVVFQSFIVELPTINTNLAEVYYESGQEDNALVLIKANLKELSQNNFKDQKEKNLLLLERILTNGSYKQKEVLDAKNRLIQFYKNKDSYLYERGIASLESNLSLLEKQEEINREKIRYNTYIFILIIIVIILFFLLNSMQLNYNLQALYAKNVSSEKKLVEMELENKKLALANTNNFISQQSQNLKNILQSSSGNKVQSAELKSKIKMLTQSFKLNDNFEKLFEEVYPGFYQKLIQRNKNLTQNDLKLCACIRLNQTSKEIAFMMGVSSRTIESQKYRLKKKLGLSKEERLTSFIFSI